VGGGAFGMARLAQLLHRRLTPSQGERPGRPTDSSWVLRPKMPMREETANKLAEIADALSTSERRISPMQVAAHLLEEAVGGLRIATEGTHEERNPAERALSWRGGCPPCCAPAHPLHPNRGIRVFKFFQPIGLEIIGGRTYSK